MENLYKTEKIVLNASTLLDCLRKKVGANFK